MEYQKIPQTTDAATVSGATILLGPVGGLVVLPVLNVLKKLFGQGNARPNTAGSGKLPVLVRAGISFVRCPGIFQWMGWSTGPINQIFFAIDGQGVPLLTSDGQFWCTYITQSRTAGDTQISESVVWEGFKKQIANPSRGGAEPYRNAFGTELSGILTQYFPTTLSITATDMNTVYGAALASNEHPASNSTKTSQGDFMPDYNSSTGSDTNKPTPIKAGWGWGALVVLVLVIIITIVTSRRDGNIGKDKYNK